MKTQKTHYLIEGFGGSFVFYGSKKEALKEGKMEYGEKGTTVRIATKIELGVGKRAGDLKPTTTKSYGERFGDKMAKE